MKKEFFFPGEDGLTQIRCIEWIPETEVRAVLQISHGMAEHIARYERLAVYLNRYGIYVVGNDHLGHGASVVSPEKHGYFANPKGNECVIADLHTLRRITREKYPELPYFMLGHSMGSFLLRQYLMLHGKGIAGGVVAGTGSQPEAVLSAGLALCKTMAKVKGWEHRSKTVSALVFGPYNKHIPHNRTVMDWLTKDTAVVDKYLEDPWCGFLFTLDGYYQLFRTIRFVQNPEHIRKTPKNLPILLISGKEDPVGEYGKGVKKVLEDYRAAGVNSVTMKLYDNDRHELLNETDCGVVFDDMRLWLEQQMKERRV